MDGPGQPGAAGGQTVRHVRKLLFVLLGTLLSASALAATLPQEARDKSLGVATCASSLCHGGIETWRNSRILQNEYVVWSRADKHARAYTVLLNERSKEIGRKLGLKEPPERAAVCLDCHAHNVADSRKGERFLMSDGVGCESCHGASERWIRSHVEPEATHAQNVANGLYPTSDHTERARLCLSCHFGNPQKFVTHKIMAAGHPRMSFELDTFMKIQPAHYRNDTEGARTKQLWDGVRIWAVGQALAAQSLLEILNDPKRGRDGLFPELVLFDCHACHNLMSGKRAAGMRLGVGPGVVRLNDSSLLMLRHIARRVNAGGDAQFQQQVTALHRSVATGSDTHAQAKAMQQLIADLVPRIAAYRFSAEDLRGILVGLIDDGLTGQYSDYQGAEQAAMALQSVADFMSQRGMLKPASIRPAMKQLLTAVENDEKYKAGQFEQGLKALKASLQTGDKR
jgi:hypothetical protein